MGENKYPKKFIEARKAYERGEHCSLAAKTLSLEHFEELKDKKTPNNWIIARAINTSFVRCHAGYLIFNVYNKENKNFLFIGVMRNEAKIPWNSKFLSQTKLTS